jgi:hypothetical protein
LIRDKKEKIIIQPSYSFLLPLGTRKDIFYRLGFMIQEVTVKEGKSKKVLRVLFRTA